MSNKTHTHMHTHTHIYTLTHIYTHSHTHKHTTCTCAHTRTCTRNPFLTSPPSKYTMNQKNAKKVPIQGTGDYRQITETFSVSMSGNFLPIQLISQGTNRCHPKFNFPNHFHLTHSLKGGGAKTPLRSVEYSA